MYEYCARKYAAKGLKNRKRFFGFSEGFFSETVVSTRTCSTPAPPTQLEIVCSEQSSMIKVRSEQYIKFCSHFKGRSTVVLVKRTCWDSSGLPTKTSITAILIRGHDTQWNKIKNAKNKRSIHAKEERPSARKKKQQQTQMIDGDLEVARSP